MTLAWTAVSDATSYNVYTSTTSPVTTSSTKTNVASAGATISSLANGTPVFAAVTAVNAGGESPLSSPVCAVPTAASTSGLTLYDALCGGSLGGAKWASPLIDLGVSGSAMVAHSQISGAESINVDGTTYNTFATVVTGGQRVSTLTADINVPKATASQTGSAEIRAVLRLVYQPPVDRLFLPQSNNLENIALEVGLRDQGTGLQAVRLTRHCDSLNCVTRTQTGMAITDPAGFTVPAAGSIEAISPAAYDTTYTVTVSLNEANGVLSWTIAGGTFGAGVSGTVDPSVYIAGNTNWAALGPNPLATANGFLDAQAGTRIVDNSVAGGGDGNITASFANVKVGFNGGAASAFDDFSGAGGNSGPDELSATKWASGPNVAAKSSIAFSSGSLAGHVQVTNSASALVQSFQGLTFNNPTAVNTIQADVNMTACSNNTAVAGRFNRVQVQGTFYNDGTAGNAPSSAVGEIRPILILDCVLNSAFYIIQRGTTATGFATISISPGNTVPIGSGAPITVAGSGVHTLMLNWDPTGKVFNFQVDGGSVVTVDPTTVNSRINTAAPVGGPAQSPQRQIVWSASMPASGTAGTASTDVKVNNVFTAP
jgi:hypothetical protein